MQTPLAIPARLWTLAGVCLALVGCMKGSPGGPRLELSIAPLSLPGVGDVCYDLRTTNASAGAGDVVWSVGDPNVDSDPDALCASKFGANGAITFVGTCDASPATAGATGRTNSVTLWVDSLEDTGGIPIAQNGPDGWQDPCPSGCTLDTLCLENTDARVEFNIAILRQANQGFFDIGVNFDDIFCSAKVDCRGPDNQPLELLFNPSGVRDTTVVSALACTAGPGNDTRTFLYRNPLVISCSGSSVTIPASTQKGNAYQSATPDPSLADAIWQYAVYTGEESLSCGSTSCNKLYWNFALGLDETFDNCFLTTRMTASREGGMNGLSTPNASTYPYIDVDIRLTDAAGLVCGKHALNTPGSGISTRYTTLSTPVSFTLSYSSLVDECALNTDNCHTNATCTDLPSGFSCACHTGYSGTGTSCTDINECLTGNGGCHTNATCANTAGSRTCACNSGYTGDGLTCTDINECLTSNGGCSTNATCTNTPGSRTCACNSGYTGDGLTCVSSSSLIIDIDPYNSASYPGTGNTITNVGSSGGTYTFLGGPTFTSPYLSYDGVDDGINLGSNHSYSRTQFSAFAWFKFRSAHTNWRSAAFSKWINGTPGHQNEWSIGGSTENGPAPLGVGVQVADGVYVSLNDGVNYDLDTWYHLGFVWDNGTLKLYKNGVFITSTTSPYTAVQSFNIDINVARFSSYYSNIDVGRTTLYSGARSDAEILADFNATKARFLPAVSDADAQTFLVNAGIFDSRRATAVDTLVTDLKAAGHWTKMKAIYPFVGGSAFKHKFNLKDPRDSDLAYRLQFSGGWTHTLEGAKPDGTGYANTFFNPKLATTAPDYYLTAGMYFRTNTSSNSMNGVWSNDTNGPNGGPFTLFFDGGNIKRYVYHTNDAPFSAPPRYDGLHSFGKRASSLSFYKHNTSDSLVANLGGNPTNGNFHWGRSNGYAGNGETREFAFAYLADGLTDAELEALYPIVQRFQERLGREVGVPVVSDTDAQKFLVAANITSRLQALAVNTLVTELKAAGVWTKLKAAYPFVGGTASSHKWNLKDPRDANDAFRLQFTNVWTHNANGITGNGTDTYADTFFDASVRQTLTSFHMSVYSRTDSSETKYDMGSYDGVRENSMLSSRSTGIYYGQFGNTSGASGTSFVQMPITTTAAHFLAQIDGTGRNEGFRNGNLVHTVTGKTNVLVANNIYIGAINSTGNRYTASKNYAFASLGDALTDAEASSFYLAIQKFQTTLGRQNGVGIYDTSLGATVSPNDILLNMNASTYTSGSTWLNATGSNHGSLVNGPTYLSTDSGGVFGLDGSNDHINFGDLAYSRSSFSVFTYFQYRSYHTNWDGSIISKWYTGAGTAGNEWSIGPSSQSGAAPLGAGIQMTNGSSFINESLSDTSNYVTGRWYYIGFTYDNGIFRLYRNGELVASKVTTYRSILTTTQPLTVGTSYDRASYCTDGKVGDIHMYNRAITPNEVLQNFNATRSRFGL